MDHFGHISYVELLVVACGFLIVLITRYSFSDSEGKNENGPFSQRKYPYHSANAASSRRLSHSSSPIAGYSKRRGRRTIGIKHL